MNLLEKESLKKSVPFDELRALRVAAFDLQSKDVDTAFKAAISLAPLVSISNCDIILDQDAVSSTISFLQICTADHHVCSACDLLSAMFPHELELVQENILKVSGIEIIEATRNRFPNSTVKIVSTLQQCVHFFNAGQNNARETGVLQRLLQLDKDSPGIYNTHACIHAMCYMNFQNSSIAESHGFDVQYAINTPDGDIPVIPEIQASPLEPSHDLTYVRPFSSRSKTSSRSSTSLDVDNLPYDIGAQIRALTSLKESFGAEKSDDITTMENSPTTLLAKSFQRCQIGAKGIRNHLLPHEVSTLNDVASRILGPRHFMDVIKRADAILKTDIPETKSSEVFGPQNHSFKTHGRVSEDAWSRVRYVQHISTASLGTKYGQHEVSFVKWFYSGQVVGERAHGNGIITWVSGSRYSGQLSDDKRHGLGKMVFDAADMSMASRLCPSAGTAYYGQWENDRIHGIGMFVFHRDDGGGSLCGIFDQGMVTPYTFSQELLPENFIDEVHTEERKAEALSAEAIQNSSSTIFRHNYNTNDGQFLFPLHYTPQRALVQRQGDLGEETSPISRARF